MPGNPRAIIMEAERQFPIRITIEVPEAGIGARYLPMTEWLDENCGLGGWAIAPAGTRGIANDAVAVFVSTPICAAAFIARWCVSGDPPGFYQLRDDEPERRISGPGHSSPPRGA